MNKTLGLLFVGVSLLINSCNRKEIIDPDPGTQVTPCFTEPSPNNGRIIEGAYIIVYRTGTQTNTYFSEARIASQSGELLQRHGILPTAIKGTFVGFQRGFIGQLSRTQVAALRQDPDIALIEPDRIVAMAACITVVDTSTLSWSTRRTGYADGTGKTAWIIDTGIAADHPDLNADLGRSRCFIEGETSVEDQNGHGTHVAGIIGAKNNRIGTLGVAAGANLVALKVLNQLGEGRISAVIKALEYVGQNARRGDVVNISLVGDTISQILDQEVIGIANKGILLAIAAGNSAKKTALVSPSRVNHPNVFTVSAMDSSDTWASFSNYGGDARNVAAPGVEVLSTSLHGGYALMSGTSMAAPHVAGLLLLDGRNFVVSGTVKNDPDGIPDPIAHKR